MANHEPPAEALDNPERTAIRRQPERTIGWRSISRTRLISRLSPNGRNRRILIVERTLIDGCFGRRRTFDARAILDHEV